MMSTGFGGKAFREKGSNVYVVKKNGYITMMNL